MGHNYYQHAINHESEHALLEKMIMDSLADHYCPWEGPGLDVEKAVGKWGFLVCRLDQPNTVVVDGLCGEHRFIIVLRNEQS